MFELIKDLIAANKRTTMKLRDKTGFILPDLHLASLPTGSVKELVDKLGRKIANGDFTVGSNIPMEPELVEEHGVSRTVVREAIKVLSGKGLVRTARRYGTLVCSTDEWNLLDPDVINWHEQESPMAHKIFHDATKFRMIFEPEAAGLAAQNASDEQVQLIADAARIVDSSDQDLNTRLAADFAFHATMLEGTGNVMLRQFSGLTHAILSFTYSTGRMEIESTPDGKGPHYRVAQEILNRDPVGATKAMLLSLMQANDKVANEIVGAK